MTFFVMLFFFFLITNVTTQPFHNMANTYLDHGDLGKFKSQDLNAKTMELSFIKTDSLFEFDFNS